MRTRDWRIWPKVVWLVVILGVGVSLTLIDEYLKLGMEISVKSDIFPLWVTSWDYPLFLAINIGIHNPLLTIIFDTVTKAGTTITPTILCALLYVGGRRNEAILLMMAVILGDLVTLSVKELIPRPRPYLLLPSAIHFEVQSGSSFPSGHSMTVFAMAAVISKKIPKYRLPAYGLAFLVVISRIYLGAHFPFDVIIGSIIGWASGMVVTRLDTRIERFLHRLAFG